MKSFSKLFFLCLTILCLQNVFGQEDMKIKNKPGGIFSLGVRTPISAFNDGDWRNMGTGAGGQFRIRIAERLNTDWFFDYVTGNVGDFASRTDYYLGKKSPDEVKVQPYVIAGHCFDYTNQKDNNNRSNFAERWSSAVQAGFGAHFNVTKRFDVSTTLQYMIHMGTDIHAEKNEFDEVVFEKESGVNLEGHMFFNVSLNYKIVDLW
jgi:opacity protein-like surface antigen